MTRLALAIALLAAACSVDRRSSALACDHSSDCADGRHCDHGYCVDPRDDGTSNGCPSPCTSCDTGKRTCEIDCGGSHACGDLTCPTGYSCTIRCTDNQACGKIDCGIGGSCDVTCAVGGACGDIDCEDTCSCDVHCLAGGACSDMACPGRLVSCTRGEQAGAACDSSVDATCNLCQ
ncbi:MAG TPA: hypothetical protein VGC42_05170 [Kofleriaceae bacterium]